MDQLIVRYRLPSTGILQTYYSYDHGEFNAMVRALWSLNLPTAIVNTIHFQRYIINAPRWSPGYCPMCDKLWDL
jgi:hypothetical protein